MWLSYHLCSFLGWNSSITVIHLLSTVIQDTQEVELGTSSPGFLTVKHGFGVPIRFFTTKFLKFLGFFLFRHNMFFFKKNTLVFGKKYFSSYSHFLLSCFLLDKLQLTKDVFAANTETMPLADIPLNPGRLINRDLCNG